MGDLGTRWRHKGRGTTYRITGWATLHSRTLSIVDVVVVIYESEADETLWVRPWTEFLDGRFERLPAPPASQNPEGTK